MTRRIGCAVLAAGNSQRLGRPKQLVAFGGVALARRAAEAACASTCDDVAVVVGAHKVAVLPVFEGTRAVVIDNPLWSEGLGSSIRAATAWARAEEHEALVLVVCDQPLLTSGHIDVLVRAYRKGSDAVASTYSGTRGVPALFSSSWFDRLAALEGARGAGAILRAATSVHEISWPEGAFDVDTEADVQRLRDAF